MTDKVIDLDVRRLRERPSRRKQAWLDTVRAAEAEHAAHDAVVGAAAGDGVELLRLQLVELAREAASLKWDREHASDARERQRLSSRRIRALRAVANAAVELHKLEGGTPSPKVILRVLGDLQALVEGCAEELFDVNTSARMLSALRSRLELGLEEITAAGV